MIESLIMGYKYMMYSAQVSMGDDYDPEEEETAYEGCLSFPGESGYVVRPNHVRVRAMNRFGEECEYEGEGLFARAILHETDHLNGIVYKRLVTEAPEGFEEYEDDD